MASAYVTPPYIMSASGPNVSLGCDTIYTGPDVLTQLRIVLEIVINPSTDTPTTIRQKIANAVQAWAVTQNITVAGPDIMLPEFQKGV